MRMFVARRSTRRSTQLLDPGLIDPRLTGLSSLNDVRSDQAQPFYDLNYCAGEIIFILQMIG